MNREELAREALERAEGSRSVANYAAILEAFMKRGIPEGDIIPRVNVLTYHAWRAKGRQVRRGEKGVPVVTWVPMRTKDETPAPATETEAQREARRNNRPMRPKTAYVFHVSQTDPISTGAAGVARIAHVMTAPDSQWQGLTS